MKPIGPTKAAQTKERILHAATGEFAAHGIAGGRVDRIARAAKANKSLIYDYFGSKEQLFTAVLDRHLAEVYRTVQFAVGDIGGYAALLFDFAMDHPHLMRLWTWNGLERQRQVQSNDNANLQAQVKAIGEAQSAGAMASDYAPEFLLTVILTLASAWTTANPFGMSIMPDAARHRTELRAAVASAVERLCKPRSGEGG